MKRLQNLSYKTLFAILFFSLAGIVFFLKVGGKTTKVSAAWWDEMWHYRKAISITNSSGSNLTDFQVSISIGTSQLIAEGKMQSDCDDIRVTDINGNLVPYWIEENNPGCNQLTDTKIWLKASSLPTSGSTIYLYYGNSSASNNENGKNVFLEFDDFKNSSNINNWTLESNPTTTYSISGGTMSAVAPSGDYSSAVIGSNYTDVIVNSRFTASAGQSHGGFIFRSQSNAADNSYQWLIRRGTSDNRVQKRLGGGQTYLLGGTGGIALPSTFTAGTWYPIEFRLSGTQVDTYFNNQQAINGSLADTGFASGKVGILSYDSNEFFDYIFVRKYASTLPVPTIQSEEIGGGPIAYWKFDEGVGTTLYDSGSGHKNGYFASTAPTWADESQCVSGKCLSFNGTQSAFSSYDVSWNNSNSVSISFWVKPQNTTDTNRGILGKKFSSYEWSFYQNNSAVSFVHWDNTGNHTNGMDDSWGNVLTANNWTHLVYSWNGSISNFYANGKLVKTKTGTNPSINMNQTNNMMFGGNIYTWGDSYFRGFIDEVKIYPYTRTADQVKQDYNSRGSVNSSSSNLGVKSNTAPDLNSKLFAYYKFNNNLNDSISVGKTAITLDNVAGNYNPNGKNDQTLDFTVKESGSFTYINNNTLRDSTKNWATNQWSGYQFAMYYTGSQWCKDTIDSNTATDIVFSSTCNSFAGSKSYVIKKTLYVSLPLSGHSTNAISASLWFKSNGSQSSRRLARMTNEAFNISLNDTSVSTGINSYSSQISYTSTPNDQKWHQIIMTYDGSTEKLYYDSVMVGTYSTAVSINSGGDLTLAARNDGVDEFFNGFIDEVKIYNSALTPEEIKQDYNQGSAIQLGQTNQNIGGTTTSLEYCIPGDTSPCSSPIAEWNFEENTGTTTKDISGNNNNGTFGTGNSAPTWTTGANNKGSGINLDGKQKIAINDNSNLKPTTAITAEAWFNTSNKSTTGQRILSKTEGSGYQLSLNENSGCASNTLCFLININGTYYSATYPSSNLSNNTWYHVTGSYDGSIVKLFLNGSNIGTTATISNTINQGNYNLCIGSETDAGSCTSGFFLGKIDHVKIYNYARTPAQIAYDYNKGKPVGWWKLDECQGNIAYDSSGVGNTGVIVIGSSGTQNSLGTCQIGTSAAWTNGASGKINSSLSFDGNDDYISGPFNTLGISKPFTLSAWFKTSTTFAYEPGIVSLGYMPIIVMRTDGKIRAWWYNGTSYPGVVSTKSYNNGIFHHATLTYDGNTAKLYIDANLEATTTSTIHSIYSGFEIGREKNSGNKIFNGQIDDARVYNYGLTSEQVKQVYNGGSVNFQ